MPSSALAWAKHVLPAVEFKPPNVKISTMDPQHMVNLSMCVCSSHAKGWSGHGEHAACVPEA